MFAVASGLFLKVTGDEILVVGGDFCERDARSPVGHVVESLTLAVDVGQVGAKAKRQTYFQSLSGCRKRHIEEATSPADLHDPSLRCPSALVNDRLQVGRIATKPAFLQEFLFHVANNTQDLSAVNQINNQKKTRAAISREAWLYLLMPGGGGSFPSAARVQTKKRERDFTFWLQSWHNFAKMQRTYRGCTLHAVARDGRAQSDGDIPVVSKHAESDQPYALQAMARSTHASLSR
jgi:hypothetical protein